jgi:hypothetical protein
MSAADGDVRANFRPGEKAELRFVVRPSEPLEECLIGLQVHRATDGLAVCDYNLPLEGLAPFAARQSGDVALSVGLNMNLLRGAYVISLCIYHYPTSRHIAWADRAANFFVEETISWQGVSHLQPVLGNHLSVFSGVDICQHSNRAGYLSEQHNVDGLA